MSVFLRVAAAMTAASLCGCVPPPTLPPTQPTEGLVNTAYADIPGWRTDALAEAVPALRAQCRRLALMPPDMALGGDGLAGVFGGRAGQWAQACAAAKGLGPTDPAVRALIETWFQPYRMAVPALVTGYFEPQARGSFQRGGIYQTPVYARPADLVQMPPTDPNGRPVMGRSLAGRLVPYWTRQEIEAGKAGAAAKPLLWLADPIDLAFLQIQGAGRVVLPDAHVLRLAYAGSNGRPYTPIGRVLIDRHALAPRDVTMQTIRTWLVAHPAEAQSVMDANARFVFFRLAADAGETSGPPGALGVDLVPGRSAALDRHVTPLGSLVFLDTTDPLTQAPWRHLVLAQDLGTDIRGPARVDVFMGAGDAAALRAGQMRQSGTVYLLLPRPPPPHTT